MRLLAWVAVLVLSTDACTMPKRLSGTAPRGDNVVGGRHYPPGVLPGPGASATDEVDGMWSTPRADLFCCWLAPDASVIADKTVVSDRAIVRVFLPPFAFFVKHTQTLDITIAAKVTTFVDLVPGVHTLSVPLDAASARTRGPLRIAFHSRVKFTPLAEHMSSDDRDLAIVLTAIAFPTY